MYTIRINVPTEGIKEITVDKETFQRLKPFIEKKSIVEIDGYVFNTAYFIDAVYTKTEEEKLNYLKNYNAETTMAKKIGE